MSIKNEANVLSVLLAFLCVFSSIFAMSADASPRTSLLEKNDILEMIKEKHKNMRAIQAVVYQEKHLTALKEPVHIEGTVILEKPGMLRWESLIPEKSITIINRNTIQVYYPDEKVAEIHKLSDNFIARNTMVFFSSVMWGDMEDMEKRFAVSMSRDNGELRIQLEPHSRIVSRYLSSIIIHYDGLTGMPRGFEVTTPKGDKTVTRIEALTVNPDIAADAFTLNLPPDVRIRDYSVTIDTN